MVERLSDKNFPLSTILESLLATWCISAKFGLVYDKNIHLAWRADRARHVRLNNSLNVSVMDHDPWAHNYRFEIYASVECSDWLLTKKSGGLRKARKRFLVVRSCLYHCNLESTISEV